MSIWLEHRLAELRFALRMIRKTPGASAIAILSLALGIGANTAIFSFVDTLLLKRLPVRAPGELYNVARIIRGRPATSWNYPDYVAFRDQNTALSGVAAVSSSQPFGLQVASDGAAGDAELAYASFVSGNYFQVLGVEAANGRLFNGQDDARFGASPYAVLSDEFWHRRFGGDAGVIGRTLRLNGYPLTVIGITRSGFRGVDVTTSPNLFVPMTMRSEVFGVPLGVWNTRHYWWFQVVGRLAPGASTAQVVTRLSQIFKAQEETERRETPGAGVANAGQPIVLLSAARGYSYVRNTLEKPLLVLMAVVGVVLLIACANMASLMLARGAARQREMAVRLAVGASRARLASQLLTESVLLSLLGGVAGLGFAYACVQLLLGFVPQYGQQIALDISPDVRALAFTLAVSVVTGIVFGLAPAVQSTRPDLVGALKAEASSGRARVTLRKALVVAQVALSILLVVGAGLFVRTLQKLGAIDLGFRPEHAVVVNIDPSRNGYKGQHLREFYERLRADVQRAPGVRSVTLASITPLSGSSWDEDVSAEGYTRRADEQRSINMNAVAPRYFETLGIPILLGRDFADADNPAVMAAPPETLGPPGREEPEPPGPRVVIVTEALAKHFFGGRNPIGLHVCFTREYDPSKAYEIVGVVKDVHYGALRQGAEEMIYLPSWRRGPNSKALILRTVRETPGIAEVVRRQAAAIDPAVPVLSARSLQQEIDNNVVVERLVATVSTFFGGLALLLASVGLYGVMAYTVSRRTREIGIRMALGASRASVVWLVLRGAAILVLLGAAIGIPAAFWATRALEAFLFGVTSQDPVTIAAAIAILAAVAGLAAFVPARRAVSVEPTAALRCD